jgi:hypothetical protein
VHKVCSALAEIVYNVVHIYLSPGIRAILLDKSSLQRSTSSELSHATGSQSALHLHVLNKGTANKPAALSWCFTWPLSDKCDGLSGSGCCRQTWEGVCTSSKSRDLRNVFTRDCFLLLAHVLQSFCEFASDIEKISNHLVGCTFHGRNKSFWCFFFIHLNYFAIFVFLHARFASIDSSAAASDLFSRYCRGLGSSLTLGPKKWISFFEALFFGAPPTSHLVFISYQISAQPKKILNITC